MTPQEELANACDRVLAAIKARRLFFERHIAEEETRENIALALDNAAAVVETIRLSPLDL